MDAGIINLNWSKTDTYEFHDPEPEPSDLSVALIMVGDMLVPITYPNTLRAIETKTYSGSETFTFDQLLGQFQSIIQQIGEYISHVLQEYKWWN